MSFEAEQIAIYKAAHRRLWGRPGKTVHRPDAPHPEWTTPKVAPVYVPSQAKMSWPRLQRLLKEVAAKHGLFTEEVLSPTKKRFVVVARWEFIYRAVAETNASIVQIGKAMGYNHSTILNGLARHIALHDLPPPRESYFKVKTRKNLGRVG